MADRFCFPPPPDLGCIDALPYPLDKRRFPALHLNNALRRFLVRLAAFRLALQDQPVKLALAKAGCVPSQWRDLRRVALVSKDQ